MPDRVRSEDPNGALAQIQQIMFGPVPAEGSRHEALVDLAHRGAEAGQTNDWILNALVVACDLWGKYPTTFDRWTRLLNMLRMARKTYPNQPDGSGWAPQWWDDTAQVTFTRYPNYETARAAELEAIATEDPLYNRADRP